jgi:hypothetical protein
VFSLKLFEYAGAGRPVLAVGTRDSDVARLIADAGLGDVWAQPRAIADQLRALQRDKQQGRSTARTPRPGFDLTRRTQFRHLERQLATLVAGA